MLRSTILDRFLSRAQRSPHLPAVRWGEDTLTYGALQARAAAIATRLLAEGVKPDDVVGLSTHRSFDMVAGVLGILEAGAAYLPLDPAYPEDRLAFMLEDSRAPVVLTQKGLRTASHFRNTVLHLDDPQWQQDTSGKLVSPKPEHLAYAIYTSGSTGKPKGVAMVHGALANLIDWQLESSKVGEGQRTLQFAPLSFDVSFQEMFATWSAGGTLVLVDESMRLDAVALLKLIEREQVARLFLPFIALQSVCDIAVAQSLIPKSLREIITAGEQLQVTPSLVAFFEALPGCSLHNHYGPSETHVVTAYTLEGPPSTWSPLPPIGTAIANTKTLILTDERAPVAKGQEGELYLGGECLARGYLHRPELTAEKFVTLEGERWYRTGDLCRELEDGNIQFLGRIDGQVKVSGYRIELGEIEVALAKHPSVKQAAVTVREDRPGDKRLVGYVVCEGDAAAVVDEVRRGLEEALPEYMVPRAIVVLDDLPRTPSGKVDRRALPAPGQERPALAVDFVAPKGATEQKLAAIWEDLLQVRGIGARDSFFELGGSSLLALKAVARMRAELGFELPIVAFFEAPTVEGLAERMQAKEAASARRRVRRSQADSGDIAIVGMAGKFPGASSVTELWRLLTEGREGTRFFRPEELDPSLDPEIVRDETYVAARGVLEGADHFDAAFFGVNPNEAMALDPQQRVLLELAWLALEDAGYKPSGPWVTGVYCGVHNNSYRENLRDHPEVIDRIGELTAMTASEKDYVATRIASKLNLTGPALSIHTACSTSLVSVVTAVQHLRAGLCDVALAGGAAITAPQRAGHLYQEGGMLSADGHTRPFDVNATGTVFSDGAGMVVLTRLEDAVTRGDHVYAVLRGVGLNNDGANKASFTAPSVQGQADVVAMAHEDAGIHPRTISYVEAHGTATPLGDPIEVEALTRAFREGTEDRGFCYLGSIKSNFGHLTAAAGVAGLIKAALSLEHQHIPASLHYTAPNPKIDFARTPFVVAKEGMTWPEGDAPRRAGVSSFGVGGTNAHVIVEEAPQLASGPSVGPQLVLVSAKSETALHRAAAHLADFCEQNPNVSLPDLSYTLKVGREELPHRQWVVARTPAEAAERLRKPMPAFGRAGLAESRARPVVFMFPGQGSQYVNMGRNLYDGEPSFRLALEECVAHLERHLGRDLREILYPAPGGEEAAAQQLKNTEYTQTALFSVEYALAQTWLEWGIEPAAMIGHSVGEFVAAVLAGVLTLPDALMLVARRGQLMQALPAGSMLSVRAGADAVRDSLPPGVDLASENAPDLCVVAGPTDVVTAYAGKLRAEGVASKALVTSHAFHSAMMEPAVAPFKALLEKVTLGAPSIPIVSTATGAWLTDAQAKSPDYWASHLRHTVRFSTAVSTVWQEDERLLLEVGPRTTLATLARKQARANPQRRAVTSLGDSADDEAEWTALQAAIGSLWLSGITPNWARYYENEARRKLPLPGYSFEPTSFWLDRAARTSMAHPAAPQTLSTLAQPPATPAKETPIMSTRKPRLVGELRELFEATSGVEFGDGDVGVPFLELGIDSLLLTQLALKLKQKYKVAITFRQLMESFPTMAQLAEHLDATLPSEAVASSVPAPAPAPGASAPVAPLTGPLVVPPMPQGAPNPAVQALVQQQLTIMQQQLLILSQTHGPLSPELMPVASHVPEAQTPISTLPEPEDEDSKPQKYDVKKAFGAIARIRLDSDGMTDTQRATLTALTESYNGRTKGSKAHAQDYRRYFADPRVVTGFRPAIKELTYPIAVVRSKGARLWDVDGNEYIDALNGFGSNFFGHASDFIQDAMRKQLDLGFEIGPSTPLAAESAKLFCELTGLDRAAFCNTGSEAVMGCMRMARTVTGRNTIVAFSGSYHGIFDEVLVRGTKSLRSIPAAPGIMPEAVSNMLILDYGTEEAMRVIKERADELAAVMVEPVQSRRPDFQPREFVRELREVTEKAGAALIFDEVITGFRTHPAGAQHFYGVQADIASYGKVPGGGMPIGAMAGKAKWMDALDGGQWQFGDDSTPPSGVTYFAGTFVRHPLIMAAVKASLEHMKAKGPALQEGISAKTTRMAEELNAFFAQAGAPLKIKHFASLWKAMYTEEQPFGDLLFVYLRAKGVHIWDGFPCFLTMAHTDQDVDFIVDAFKESVREMQAGELLPHGPHIQPKANFKADEPPVPGAKLGRTPSGDPAWFVPDPTRPGKYQQVG